MPESGTSLNLRSSIVLMNPFSLRRSLMLAGLLPFIFGTLANYLNAESWWIISTIPESLAMYALAIVSFMSGVHWGIAQVKITSSALLVHSNVMVLLPWVVFATLGHGGLFYLVLAGVVLKQVWLDHRLAKDGCFDDAYLLDRTVISTLVSALLFCNALIIFQAA